MIRFTPLQIVVILVFGALACPAYGQKNMFLCGKCGGHSVTGLCDNCRYRSNNEDDDCTSAKNTLKRNGGNSKNIDAMSCAEAMMHARQLGWKSKLDLELEARRREFMADLRRREAEEERERAARQVDFERQMAAEQAERQRRQAEWEREMEADQQRRDASKAQANADRTAEEAESEQFWNDLRDKIRNQPGLERNGRNRPLYEWEKRQQAYEAANEAMRRGDFDGYRRHMDEWSGKSDFDQLDSEINQSPLQPEINESERMSDLSLPTEPSFVSPLDIKPAVQEPVLPPMRTDLGDSLSKLREFSETGQLPSQSRLSEPQMRNDLDKAFSGTVRTGVRDSSMPRIDALSGTQRDSANGTLPAIDSLASSNSMSGLKKFAESGEVISRANSAGKTDYVSELPPINALSNAGQSGVKGGLPSIRSLEAGSQQGIKPQGVSANVGNRGGELTRVTRGPSKDGEVWEFKAPPSIDGSKAPRAIVELGVQSPGSSIKEVGEQFSLMGFDVTAIHNAPANSLVSDLRNAAIDSGKIPRLDPEGRGRVRNESINSMRDTIIRQVSTGEPVRIFVHSEGEIVAVEAIRQAAKHFAAEGSAGAKKMSKIELMSFGGGYGGDASDVRSYVGRWSRIRHENDLVPKAVDPALRGQIGGADNADKAHSFGETYMPFVKNNSDIVLKQSGNFIIGADGKVRDDVAR